MTFLPACMNWMPLCWRDCAGNATVLEGLCWTCYQHQEERAWGALLLPYLHSVVFRQDVSNIPLRLVSCCLMQSSQIGWRTCGYRSLLRRTARNWCPACRCGPVVCHFSTFNLFGACRSGGGHVHVGLLCSLCLSVTDSGPGYHRSTLGTMLFWTRTTSWCLLRGLRRCCSPRAGTLRRGATPWPAQQRALLRWRCRCGGASRSGAVLLL